MSLKVINDLHEQIVELQDLLILILLIPFIHLLFCDLLDQIFDLHDVEEAIGWWIRGIRIFIIDDLTRCDATILQILWLLLFGVQDQHFLKEATNVFTPLADQLEKTHYLALAFAVHP